MFKEDLHLMEMIKGSAIALILKIFGMLFGYILLLIISNKIGAEGVGYYQFFIQLITLLATVLALGTNISVLRFIGEFKNELKQSKIPQLYKLIMSIVGPTTIFFGGVLYFYSENLVTIFDKSDDYIIGLKLVGFSLPFFTLNLISVEFLRGLKQLKFSELIRSVTRPLIMIIGVLLFFHDDLNKVDVLCLFMLAIICNAFISRFIIYFKLKSISRVKNLIDKRKVFRTSLPMLLTSVSSILLSSMPIFFLDQYTSQVDTGIFSVAFRISILVSIITFVITTIAGPKFAELYWSNKIADLKKLVRQSVNFMFWISFTFTIILTLGSKWILGIFGEEFTNGSSILIILLFGQLVNSATGNSGLLLNMSGNQKIVSKVMGSGTVITAIAYYFVVPVYGIEGAAFVYVLIGAFGLNIILAILAYRRLNIVSYFTLGLKTRIKDK